MHCLEICGQVNAALGWEWSVHLAQRPQQSLIWILCVTAAPGWCAQSSCPAVGSPGQLGHLCQAPRKIAVVL